MLANLERAASRARARLGDVVVALLEALVFLLELRAVVEAELLAEIGLDGIEVSATGLQTSPSREKRGIAE
jgi:hypothetical protein